MNQKEKNILKKVCSDLNQELDFFQEILLDILIRQAVFKKINIKLKQTTLSNTNDVFLLISYGYIISQIADLRKFFDPDIRAHQFSFITCHLSSKKFIKKHENIHKFWKEKNLEAIANKRLLHADKDFDQQKMTATFSDIDTLIKKIEKYMKEIIVDLDKNYKDITTLDYGDYLSEREKEVNTFFEEIKQVQ